MSQKKRKDYEVQYPIRERGDSKKFLIYLIILPSLITVLVCFGCAALSFQNFSWEYYLMVSGLHWLVLLVFLILLWIPSWLAITEWPETVENLITYIRNILLMGMTWFFFPYSIAENFFHKTALMPGFERWYWGAIIVLSALFFFLAFLSLHRTALRDILAGKEPRERKYSEKWLWFNALTFFLVLGSVFVIEFWFMTNLGQEKITRHPHNIVFYEKNKSGQTVPDSATVNSGVIDILQANPQEIKTDTSNTLTAAPGTIENDTAKTIAAAPPVNKPGMSGVPSSSTEQNNEIPFEQRVYRLRVISWLGCAILCTFIFFLWGCMGNRLMKEILIPVTFHERDVEGVILKAYSYLWQFLQALTLRHPFLFIMGGIVAIVVLVIPLLFVSAGQYKFLEENIIGTDQAIWTIGIIVAWFSPIVSALVHPDETFGDFFNKRLANLLMMVQGHKVIIGFGNLGRRVTDREVRQLQEREFYNDAGNIENGRKKRRRNRNGILFKKEKHFLEVVTPDVRLEKLCTSVVVIDRSAKDIVYSSQNSLLDMYGVVAAGVEFYKSKDLQGDIIHPEKRLLVPIVIGEAKEPFISSRVNLERAILIISTVPDVDSVQSIFDRASRSGVNAIISVSRSDQISYLTYRARHHPIVLVYPKHNQGSTLGHRLWVAMLKIRALYPDMKPHEWPRVLVVGNSKAYRFMIETLWGYLPGSHKERIQLAQEKFKFIVTAAGEPPGHPELKEKPDKEAFDMYWPESFIASGRFPYAMEQMKELNPLNLDTRLINEADVKAIVECIHEHQPHILVINHDDVQKSALMLLRCMRSLEKLKMINVAGFHLPLLLLSAAQGDLREKYVLGDASRYYDALCKIHQEPLAADYSYPYHSRFDHFTREIVGETISDSLADAEEIIIGARRSFSAPENNDDSDSKSKQFIEIAGCLPNIPGALADYLAKLARIKFAPVEWDKMEKIWQKLPDEKEANEKFTNIKIKEPHIPSFQYLRHVKLGDIEKRGFALTGYAALLPVTPESSIFDPALSEKSKVVRLLANDGRPYTDKKFDLDETYGSVKSRSLLDRLHKIKDPEPPGVPNVIDRLTQRGEAQYNTIDEYRQVMLDPQPGGASGNFACPGMNLCRIAAFQDYVSASNNLRLSNIQSKTGTANEVLHARNYYCCPDMQHSSTAGEKPNHDSAYARVFCCAFGSHRPGMIATIMNTLFFRRDFKLLPPTGANEEDWRINIDYFNHIPCQNSYFTLNRLFGVFEATEDKNKKENKEKNKDELQSPEKPALPLHLVRILPIGGMDSAKLWYNYAYALYRFLQGTDTKATYGFYWFSGDRKRHEEQDIPEFDSGRKDSYPILIVIKRMDRPKGVPTPEGTCEICGLQDENYDCKKYRAWV